MPKVFNQHRRAVQMIHRDVEVTLNLRRVQIQSQRATRARSFQQIRHELRGDRDARLVFAVLPRVAVVRQHRGNAPSRRALECVNHQQQLEQVVIHRVMARLHDEDVCAADVFQNLEINLAITEPAQQCLAQRNIQVFADAFREHGVRRAGKNLKPVVIHSEFSPNQLLKIRMWSRLIEVESRKLTVERRYRLWGSQSTTYHPRHSSSTFNFKLSTVNLCGDAEEDSTSRTRAFIERCASHERTCRARVSRKRRSDRAETQQRLGAPSLGSGKFQTPPNRYPPARLLSLLFGARSA